MEIKDKELHRITTTCIIYNDEGKYLITQRSKDKKFLPGIWHVPGGGLNTDDYINLPKAGQDQVYNVLTICLLREIKEEVNIEISKPEYLTDLAFIRPDGVPVLCLSYFAKYLSGNIKLDEDTINYAWVTIDELKNYDLIKGLEKEIEMVDKILKERN
jgi:8-oxo-dGTP pyrophosphatase MutT (NUDIX family)